MSQLHVSDLEKTRDALQSAYTYHLSRDHMNAAQHLGTPRHSPLTSVLEAELERLDSLIDELRENNG